MIPIYITSWNRLRFTERTINEIHKNTLAPFTLHVFDNGSDPSTQAVLHSMLNKKTIDSLFLSNKNTGCLYDKLIFQAMTETQEDFYVVSDNDVLPPFVEPDWLTQMSSIMTVHKELGLLALQFPPQTLMKPYEICDDIVYCKYVGNTFKMVRREAFLKIIPKWEQKIGQYGDDGLLSNLMHKAGYKVACCLDLYCLHIDQCLNWGYELEQIKDDPRKVGYSNKPFIYSYDSMTYKPEEKWLIKYYI